jgi:CBS domain-containing protein
MPNEAHALMTSNVLTVSPDDTVATIAGIFAAHNISAVPVCDKAGTLLGMVSEGDLMRPFAESNDLRRSWWLSLLAEGADLAPDFVEYVRRDRLRARDLMTAPVVTATESTTLPQLSELMTRHRIKRVPIVRDGRMVGIVSRADLVRAFSRMRPDAVDQE